MDVVKYAGHYSSMTGGCEPADEVVISGISGVFPKCDNVNDLSEKLFKKANLITDLEENISLGKINDASKFDAEFFNINSEQADYMDPMCRILLEKTYEAIYDSGYNPSEFRDTNTAVYVGCCTSEAEIEGIQRTDVEGAIICERAQSFLANRISFWLGTHGTSCVLNTACSASIHALELAYKAIRLQECDAAIIGGCNLALSSDLIRSYKNLGITSKSCRSFDDSATGFCKSEAVCAIFLQKAAHARRIYARIGHVKTNHDGFKKQSILFPSATIQTKLINELYADCGMDKFRVSWVEAHGTGTRVGDYEEMRSLETFLENRSTPLLVGCVKSNIGHTEAASGLCSLIKVIIAMETGFIPPNINYTKPQAGIVALTSGKIKIISETTAFDGGYVSINNFGIGGSNGHVLLKSHEKIKREQPECDDATVSWLITVSGRTVEAVDCILNYIEANPVDSEFIGLLHSIHRTDITGHKFRGYTIRNVTDAKRNMKNIRSVQHIGSSERKRSIWFVFSGMGSQWLSMAKQLMNIPTFGESINKCHDILAKKNINLKRVITGNEAGSFDNILNCFVGIISVEIALVDTLTSLGIVADSLIGHSLGEIACGYADGCLSLEETLLVAYYRGYASLEVNHRRGLMATVIGVTYEQMTSELPEDVDIACFNGKNNFTVSGPVESVCRFVEKMKTLTASCALINSGDIAYHSRYVVNVASSYRNYVQKIIKKPKDRSLKWISTSMTDSSDSNLKCDSDYFYNNFIGPVYFHRAVEMIKENSVVIEISPHSILRTVLSATTSSATSITNIQITNKYSTDGLVFFLTALGTLYQNGVNMNIGSLYRPVVYPVCKGTAMLNSLIGWDHSTSWYVPYMKQNRRISHSSTGNTVDVNIKASNFQYLSGHVLNDTIVLPEMFYLVMVWRTMMGAMYDKTRVHFQDVYFLKVVPINERNNIKLDITVQKGSGDFEISLDSETIVSGHVCFKDVPDYKLSTCPFITSKTETEKDNVNKEYKSECIYKEFRLRGYKFKNQFCRLISINCDGTVALVKYDKNWVAYLNSLVQISFFREYSRDVSVVSKIENLVIDPTRRKKKAAKVQDTIVRVFDDDLILSDDVYMNGIEKTVYKTRSTFNQPPATLQTFQFVPYASAQISEYENAVRVILTVVIDNVNSTVIKITEEAYNDSLSNVDARPTSLIPLIKLQLKSIPSCTVDIDTIPSYNAQDDDILFTDANCHLIIANNILNNKQKSDFLSRMVVNNGFILTREKAYIAENNIDDGEAYVTCSVYHLPDETIYLLRNKKCLANFRAAVTFEIPRDELDGYRWVSDLQSLLKQHTTDTDIIVYAENNPCSGVIGFCNCLRKEPQGHRIKCFFLPTATKRFNPDDDLYRSQLVKGLVTNVLKNNIWGCYVPFVLTNESRQLSSEFYVEAFTTIDDEITARCINYDSRLVNRSLISQSSLVRVYYASLDYAEVEPKFYSKYTFEEYKTDNVFPMMSSDLSFGFSGLLDNDGMRVMGICLSGVLATSVAVEKCLLWPVPDNWTLKESAAVPFSYFVTMASLLEYGDIRNGQTILINAAARSHFGVAAINIAAGYGCTIFTLENNEEDKRFIETGFNSVRRIFTVDESGVFLEQLIKTETNDQKVDIVVNIDDNNHEVLIGALRVNGLYLQIGPREPSKSSIIGRKAVQNLRYRSVRINKSFWEDVAILNRAKEALFRLMKFGFIKPFSMKSYSTDNLDEACRYYNVHHRSEKVVVELRDERPSNEVNFRILVAPKFVCSENHSYIICGGLGGMGFELAHWLVGRGVRKLILTSRTGRYDDYRRMHIDIWRKHGVRIVISTADITREEGIVDLLGNSNSLGSVAAIFNATLVLRDGLFSNQTEENFQLVNAPKAVATKLLDNISRTLCPELQYFVIFSSISCGYGNAGQTNYALANSVMERVCEERSSVGFRSVAIEWASVGDVGYLEDKSDDFIGGNNIIRQSIKSCLDTMERFLCLDLPVVSSFVIDDELQNTSHEEPISNNIESAMKKITGKNINFLRENSTLNQIGLDSINVAEIVHILKRCYGISLNANDVMKLKVSELKSLTCKNAPSSSPLNLEYVEKISTLGQLYKNLLELSNTEDIVSPKPILRLPSCLQHGSVDECSLAEERTIFFLPGIEGLASGMASVAANIDLQVLCFQYNFKISSIRDLALSLLPEIKRRFKSDKMLIIMGYSYGGLIALEIASMLQTENITCLLYIVDSSPTFVKRINDALYDAKNFHVNISEFIKAAYPEVDAELLDDTLKNCHTTWQEAVQLALNFIPNDHSSRKLDLNLLLTGIINKHTSIVQYSAIPKMSLKCPAILIRAADSVLQVPQQHDLSDYFTTPIQEFIVSGNHFTMLQSPKLSYFLMNLHKKFGPLV